MSTSFGSGNDVIKALALQPDGKILAGGYSFQGTSNDMAFARYLPDGTLDTTFDGDGKRIVSFVSGNDFCTGMTLQPDGRVVCVGYASNGTNDDMAVLRLSPDGSLDTTFDGDGKLTIIPGSQSDQLHAAAMAQDGDIAAAGLSQNASGVSQFAVVRLIGPFPSVSNLAGVQSNDLQTVRIGGQVDPAGLSTTVTLEWGTSAALGVSFSLGTFTGHGLQAFNGAFGNAGGLTLGTTYYYRVVATNANGTTTSSIQTLVYAPGARDFTFGGGDGVALTPVIDGATARAAQARDVVIQPDGRTVVAGWASNGTNDDFAVARYLSDGSPDGSFGTGGLVRMPLGSGHDRAFGIALQGDGKFVVAGSAAIGSDEDFAIVRLLPDGTLDSSFGTGGMVTVGFGSGFNDSCQAIALQADGSIVVGGFADNSGTIYYAMARLTTNGMLDGSLDGDGKLTTQFSTFVAYGTQVAIQSDGKRRC